MKELKRCIFLYQVLFFVSMKGLELNCTLPSWLSVHQTNDYSTSIMCTGHKTPMDCCCWLQTYTYPKAEIIFIVPLPKVRTTLIFFSFVMGGWQLQLVG